VIYDMRYPTMELVDTRECIVRMSERYDRPISIDYLHELSECRLISGEILWERYLSEVLASSLESVSHEIFSRDPWCYTLEFSHVVSMFSYEHDEMSVIESVDFCLWES
jgi:hypothetical protein